MYWTDFSLECDAEDEEAMFVYLELLHYSGAEVMYASRFF